MTVFSLAVNSFRYYYKNHLGLLFGAFLASAILSGSLVIGDSVRASLRSAAAERLGKVQGGIVGGDRWFTETMALHAGATPLLFMSGSVSASNAEQRVNGAQVLGVTPEFWKLAPLEVASLAKLPVQGDVPLVHVNESLARKLSLKEGDAIVIRMELPSVISRDAPLSGDTNQATTLRRKVGRIVKPENFGNFQLAVAQTAPETVFVPLADLQEVLEKKGLVNALLDNGNAFVPQRFAEYDDAPPTYAQAAAATLQPALPDYALKLSRVKGASKEWEIRTDRVFLDEALASKLVPKLSGSYGVLTYLVNGLNTSKSEARTPYSMVTAGAMNGGLMPEGKSIPEGSAAISQWLADDLSLVVGDSFDIRFFTVGIGREMKEETASFKVGAILAMTDPAVNRSWTPDFPGVSDVDNCRDWQPGIPVKLDAIRDKDEKYWDDYRGTPKAFLALADGQKLWGNRFGNLTSIRFPDTGQNEEELAREIASHLALEDIGLVAREFAVDARNAARGSVDFGGLFIGLSMFLIAAALVFSALLFLFTLEQRARQVGVLLAIGWTPAQVRKSLLTEAGLVAVVGSALGLLGGIVYTQLALAGLNGIWSGATVGMKLFYSANPVTLVIALVAALVTSMGTLWWCSRRMFRSKAKDLLVGEIGVNRAVRKSGGRLAFVPLVLVILAVVLSVVGGRAANPQLVAGLFFSAGFMLLAAGLLFVKQRWSRPPSSAGAAPKLTQVAYRNVTRRPGRSLAVVGMMAGGIFLVIAVNAFRQNADSDPTKRATGTGGFALLGESTLPIYEDLNTEEAWETFALDDRIMKSASVVPFRVRDGDDASCLNLNRAQSPSLVAVNPKPLADRGAFAFAKGDWNGLLPAEKSGPVVYGIADQATAMWGLGKGVGDTLDYTDAKGQVFQVQLVGLLAGSVLQGKIIISENDFLLKYPDAAGYKFFLIDAKPGEDSAKLQSHLTRQMEMRGLALESAASRLSAFQAVQNTYIGIFTVLGGLGVLLGTAGLGVLAMRNVLERKGEFALMQAIGFRGADLRGMVLREHGYLLVTGLVLGLVAAALGVWPSLAQSGGSLPQVFLLILAAGILLFGFFVCWVAALLALRGRFLNALRKE